MVQILDVFERTLALLASQFRDEKLDGTLTNFQKLIKILCEPAQELQNVSWQLKTERWLSSAIGEQLDQIGIILGLPRLPNESDEDYRERLQFQIFINISSGTPEDIIRAIKFLTKAERIVFFDVFPAFFQLETDGLKFPIPASDLNEAIFNMSPAGVNYAPITATQGEQYPLIMAGDFISESLYVSPDEISLRQVSMMPYDKILFVNAGAIEDLGEEGGLDELGFEYEGAGVISELIQIDGNFPARR